MCTAKKKPSRVGDSFQSIYCVFREAYGRRFEAWTSPNDVEKRDEPIADTDVNRGGGCDRGGKNFLGL